ncbi:MAG TPA: hypothetical protein VKY15_05645, partial [Acidimicrobiales bacterium]|nr:hypothetical protein [Acidimicrobiales bacterium]
MTWRRVVAGLVACALGALGVQVPAPPVGADPTADTGAPLSATGNGPPPAAQPGPGPQDVGPPPAPAGEDFAPAHPLQAIPGLQAQVRAAQAALGADSAAQDRARERLGADLESQALEASRLAALRDRQYRAALGLVQARARMRKLAVEDFVSGGYAGQELNALLSSGTVQQMGQRQAIVRALSANLADAEASLRQAERQAQGAAGPVADALARASSAV